MSEHKFRLQNYGIFTKTSDKNHSKKDKNLLKTTGYATRRTGQLRSGVVKGIATVRLFSA